MKETQIYHKMKDKLSPMGVLLQRIEMDMVPDLFYRTYHKDGWIELKRIEKLPVRNPYIKVPFRPGQMNWIRIYRTLNGKIFLFFSIVNELFIFRGANIKERYTRKDLITFNCYRSLWNEVNWDQVYELLDSNLHH